MYILPFIILYLAPIHVIKKYLSQKSEVPQREKILKYKACNTIHFFHKENLKEKRVIASYLEFSKISMKAAKQFQSVSTFSNQLSQSQTRSRGGKLTELQRI